MTKHEGKVPVLPGESFDHGYALLIGVGVTSEPKWSLPVTVNDVRAIHAILTDPELCAYPNNEEHVRLLHDEKATGKAILDGLAWLKTKAAADPDATVVVYYSGHGWLDPFTTQYALIPHEFNAADIPGSVLAAEDFTNALREIEARRLLVFVDSCHAEGMATAKDEAQLPADFMKTALPEPLIHKLKQGEGRAVFTSSRGKQRSWIRSDYSMSIYTYHLVEALHGVNNQLGETVVHVSDLMKHLGKTVPESACELPGKPEQTPCFNTATEDFPIAMLRGGKGLPAGGKQALQREFDETIRQVLSIINSSIVTGDGNIIGNGNVSQVVKAEGGGKISGVRQNVKKP